MVGARPDVFRTALAQLRERLREGAFPTGKRITAVELADELRLSATPIREALSRLAGEGVLVDRRGQGFFVRQLTAPDIADLYRLGLAQLLIALDVHRGAAASPASALDAEALEAVAGADPIRRAEVVLSSWVAVEGSPVLLANFQRVQGQLALVRRLEPRLLPDLAAETAALVDVAPGGSAERLAAARRWHVRRIRLSHQLAALLDPEQRISTL